MNRKREVGYGYCEKKKFQREDQTGEIGIER